ncbi:unnamed protein product [Pleuronectes platessa]|uniref:Uncharacterized protein n=1 Tax=Pleuronectes platessa TaxID=8262 RepID=A0A9N7VQ64_PLEPL|nr:unnamed protein product [Pleuronectes platessa]
MCGMDGRGSSEGGRNVAAALSRQAAAWLQRPRSTPTRIIPSTDLCTTNHIQPDLNHRSLTAESPVPCETRTLRRRYVLLVKTEPVLIQTKVAACIAACGTPSWLHLIPHVRRRLLRQPPGESLPSKLQFLELPLPQTTPSTTACDIHKVHIDKDVIANEIKMSIV